ncbi:MAG: LPS export ABC transporter periplasmic protein LptC [Bacteroidia bacterium]
MKLRVIIFSTLCIVLISFNACENNIDVVNLVTNSTEELPIKSDKDVEILYSDSAQVRAKLIAPRLNQYAGKKPYIELPKGMEIIFYNEKKEQETKLTADYGIGYNSDASELNKMEAKKNVVVINEKGERLNTEHLIWDAITKKIYTEEFVKITTKNETIWGDGLRANEDFSKYEILHPKGSIALKDSDIKNN